MVGSVFLIHPSIYSHPSCLCSPSSETGSCPLKGCEGNCGPGGNWWQPTAGFMTHVICRLTAKNRDQLSNPTLGNRVWATFTFLLIHSSIHSFIVKAHRIPTITREQWKISICSWIRTIKNAQGNCDDSVFIQSTKIAANWQSIYISKM